MKCSNAVRASAGTLGLVYVLAQGMLRDSPVSSQVASVITLMLMMEPECARTDTGAIFLTVLTVNLVARSIAALALPKDVELSAKIVRWDTAAAFLGIAYTTIHGWNVVLSSNRKKRTVFTYVLAALFVLPLLGALPGLIGSSTPDKVLFRTALEESSSVYSTHNVYDPVTDTRANVSAKNNAVWIAFAGTDSSQNVRTDFNVADDHPDWSCASSKMRVHSGFNNAYTSVRSAVLEAVKTSKIQDIIVTGHSLGGALAALCAHDLSCQGYSVTCVTFGAPQVGDKLFARAIKAKVRCIRVVTPYDPVPKSLSSQFVHSGSLVVLGSDEVGANAHDLNAYKEGLEASKVSAFWDAVQPALFALVVIVLMMHKFTK